MNRTTKTAIDVLTAALAKVGLTDTSVYPAEPVSCYDGSQCTIGYNTVNYFLRDDAATPCWCLEVTYEDSTYDSYDDVSPEKLAELLRAIPNGDELIRYGSDGQQVRYADADDASEHFLRMAEGLC